MRVVFAVVWVLVFSVVGLTIPVSKAGETSSLELINCCLKTADKPGIVECKKMTKKDCMNAGGKVIKDCAKCK
jgi:hypothetical protein